MNYECRFDKLLQVQIVQFVQWHRLFNLLLKQKLVLLNKNQNSKEQGVSLLQLDLDLVQQHLDNRLEDPDYNQIVQQNHLIRMV